MGLGECFRDPRTYLVLIACATVPVTGLFALLTGHDVVESLKKVAAPTALLSVYTTLLYVIGAAASKVGQPNGRVA